MKTWSDPADSQHHLPSWTFYLTLKQKAATRTMQVKVAEDPPGQPTESWEIINQVVFFKIKNKATKVWRGMYVAIGTFHWYIVCESSISSSSLWLSSISGIAAYPSHLSSSEESENTKVWVFVFWLIHIFKLLLAYLIASKICSWGLEFWISNVNHFWSSEKA